LGKRRCAGDRSVEIVRDGRHAHRLTDWKMSFRTRLSGFFLLIVVVPMIAVGILVFRLINDSEQGKADARANGLAVAAASVYATASAAACADAQMVGRAVTETTRSRLSDGSLPRRARTGP
jgi:hypothetical protein